MPMSEKFLQRAQNPKERQMLDRTEILDIAREYVAGRWNCRLDDLNKDGVIFAINDKMPLRF